MGTDQSLRKFVQCLVVVLLIALGYLLVKRWPFWFNPSSLSTGVTDEGEVVDPVAKERFEELTAPGESDPTY